MSSKTWSVSWNTYVVACSISGRAYRMLRWFKISPKKTRIIRPIKKRESSIQKASFVSRFRPRLKAYRKFCLLMCQQSSSITNRRMASSHCHPRTFFAIVSVVEAVITNLAGIMGKMAGTLQLLIEAIAASSRSSLHIPDPQYYLLILEIQECTVRLLVEC